MTRSRIPFETSAQQKLRNVRNDQGGPNLVGYHDVEGELRAVIGNLAGPYMNIVGRASEDAATGLVAVSNGEPQLVATDELGHLWARITAGDGVLTYHTAAVALQATIRAGASRVFQVRGVTDASVTADRFLQVHNSAAAVANGAEPVWELLIPAANTSGTQYAEGADDFEPIGGLVLATGLTLAISTTPGVLTLPGAADSFFMASYRAEA